MKTNYYNFGCNNDNQEKKINKKIFIGKKALSKKKIIINDKMLKKKVIQTYYKSIKQLNDIFLLIFFNSQKYLIKIIIKFSNIFFQLIATIFILSTTLYSLNN